MRQRPPVSNNARREKLLGWFVDNVRQLLVSRGCVVVGERAADGRDEGIALHPVDPEAPRPYRRKSRAIFVVGMAEVERTPADVLRTGYPLLVRSLSNVFILLAPEDGHDARPQAYFVTLEQGYYTVPFQTDERSFLEAVVDRLTPLATSTLVIGNEFVPDLPEALWKGDAHTESIARAGERLAALDLLPAPFPLQELLPPRDYRHVMQLFGIGGLSYGNVSARHDEASFWMSASGIDKRRLYTVGRDILLVKDYDPRQRALRLSVPRDCHPRRVSVDAIEHLMIYREHPGVGAILHLHAWMEGVPITRVNYPCGTLELAQEVSALVRQADDPTHAVIGLKNHGLTITGPSLDEIFARIEGRIVRQVPMS